MERENERVISVSITCVCTVYVDLVTVLFDLILTVHVVL